MNSTIVITAGILLLMAVSLGLTALAFYQWTKMEWNWPLYAITAVFLAVLDFCICGTWRWT